MIFPLPRLLRDILQQLLLQLHDVEVVDCSGCTDGITEGAIRAGADLVIATQRQAQPRVACALLERLPRCRVLAVSTDGRSGDMYELRPYRREVAELSATAVEAAVRSTPPSLETLLFESLPRPAF